MQSLLIPLEVSLVLTAFIVTTSDSIQKIIAAYRIQSGLIAAATVITASAKVPPGQDASLLIFFIFILPVVLAVFIKTLLERATVSTLSGHDPAIDAEEEWLKYKASRKTHYHSLWFLALVFLAFLIAFQIFPDPMQGTGWFIEHDRIGLMVFLALHLIGLYNMVIKQDLISQVIGLLIMDHGLYLAVVKIVDIPVPAGFFVLSLYFYTLITVFILVFLLPRVRQVSQTIDLSEIADRSRLKG